MNNINKIEKQILDIGLNAKKASLKVSLLSTKDKNEILIDASKNLQKNKNLIIEKNKVDINEHNIDIR